MGYPALRPYVDLLEFSGAGFLFEFRSDSVFVCKGLAERWMPLEMSGFVNDTLRARGTFVIMIWMMSRYKPVGVDYYFLCHTYHRCVGTSALSGRT